MAIAAGQVESGIENVSQEGGKLAQADASNKDRLEQMVGRLSEEQGRDVLRMVYSLLAKQEAEQRAAELLLQVASKQKQSLLR